MSCLSLDELNQYLGGELSAAKAEHVQRHLVECESCAAQLARLNGLIGVPAEDSTGAIDALETLPADDSFGSTAADGPIPALRANDESLIPGYTIHKELHRGGQGVVYQATQTSTKRKVAIKLLLDGQFASKAARRRFEREIELAASLKHPNIVAIFDSGQTSDGRQYFVMDYVQGESLTRYTRDRELAVQETLSLYAKVCDAIQYAHQRGVIHRDLKPGNILVDADGEPKVLDFGLAKQIGGPADTLLSMTGQIVGTLAYMSPEQARGNPDEVDTRTDVYALGVILYEMLTGSTPYPATDAMAQILQHILEAEPSRPSTVNHSLGDELDTMVLKLLSKEPVRRYQSAGDVAADVRRYLVGEAIEAKRDSGWYVFKKSVRRHRGAIGTAAAFVLLLVGASIASTTMYFRAEEQRALAQKSAEEARIAQDDAETARSEALDNLKLAEQRADELQEVSDFQGSMLEGLDGEAMGRAMLNELRDETRERWAQRKLTNEELDQKIAEFDALFADVNVTNVALTSLDAQILSRAEKAIDETFADQPLIQANLYQTVADVLREIGLYDRAEPVQRHAIDIRTRELGEDAPETLHSRLRLGHLCVEQSDFSNAKTILKGVLEARESTLGETHRDTLESTDDYAASLMMTGQFDVAEKMWLDLLETCKAELGEKDPVTLTVLHNLGYVMEKRSQMSGDPYIGDSAIAYYEAALDGRREVLGDDDRETLLTLSSLSGVLVMSGRAKRGEQVARDAYDVMRRVYGDDHSHTVGALNNLGMALQFLWRFDEAEACFRTSEAVLQRTQGKEGIGRLTALLNLGTILIAQRRPAEALPILRETESKLCRQLGDRNMFRLLSQEFIGRALFLDGQIAEAEAVYRETIPNFNWTFGSTNPVSVIPEFRFILLLISTDRVDEADKRLKEILVPTRKIHRKDAYFLQLGLGLEGAVLARRGLFAEAEPLMIGYIEFMRTRGNPLNPFMYHESEDIVAEIIRMYENWHAAEPGNGYDAKAAEWREKLRRLDALLGYGKNEPPPAPRTLPTDTQPSAETQPATAPAGSGAPAE